MITFQYLKADKVGTFDHVEIPLDVHPLIIVRGRNLDRRTRNSSNAVGKSLLFSLIPTLRYGKSPTAIRKKSAKDIIANKESYLSLKVRVDKDDFVLEQFAKGKTTAYNTIKNGKGLKFRRSSDAFNSIASILPISQEQFFTTTLINGRMISLLQRGTPTQRIEFFENLLKFDICDKIYSKLSRRFNELKYQVQQLQELKSDFQAKKADLPAKELQDYVTRRNVLMSKIQKVNVRVNSYLKELTSISTFISLAQDFKPDELSKDKTLLQADLANMISTANKLRRLIKSSVKYHTQKAQYNSNYIKRKKLLSKIKQISAKPENLPTYEANLSKYATQLAELNTSIEHSRQADNVKIQMIRLKLPVVWQKKAKNLTVKEIELGIAAERSKNQQTQKVIDQLSDIADKAKCPTCQQLLSAADIAQIIDQYNKLLVKRQANIKRWQSVLQYKRLDAQLIELANPLSTNSLLARHKKLTIRHNELKGLIDSANKVKKLQETLSYLAPPDTKFIKRNISLPDVYETRLSDLTRKIDMYKQLVAVKEKIAFLKPTFSSLAEAQFRYTTLQTYIDKYQPLLDKAQTSMQDLSATIAKAETISKDLAKLQARISDHQTASAEYKIYTALREAYGPKGLRRLRITNIAAMLEHNLNKFSHLIFGEKIVFKIIAGLNKFDILAEHNNKPAIDVRTLSGSESSAFILLTVLALLPFVPPNVRSNLLILDEIESGMDEPSRQLFVNEFLPVLQQIVKNIIIITPQSEETFYISNAVEYVVTKQHGISTLSENKFALDKNVARRV